MRKIFIVKKEDYFNHFMLVDKRHEILNEILHKGTNELLHSTNDSSRTIIFTGVINSLFYSRFIGVEEIPSYMEDFAMYSITKKQSYLKDLLSFLNEIFDFKRKDDLIKFFEEEKEWVLKNGIEITQNSKISEENKKDLSFKGFHKFVMWGQKQNKENPGKFGTAEMYSYLIQGILLELLKIKKNEGDIDEAILFLEDLNKSFFKSLDE